APPRRRCHQPPPRDPRRDTQRAALRDGSVPSETSCAWPRVSDDSLPEVRGRRYRFALAPGHSEFATAHFPPPTSLTAERIGSFQFSKGEPSRFRWVAM